MKTTSIIATLAACVAAASVSAAISPPTAVFTQTEGSYLWHTAPSGTFTVRWAKPAGATRATLSVVGSGFSRTWDNLTAEELTLSLPAATSLANEDVYRLTLTFDDEAASVRTAYLGAVIGLGTGAQRVAAQVKSDLSPKYPRFTRKAVVAIPFGVLSLTVNGTPLPGLDGEAGWRVVGKGVNPGPVALSMAVAGSSEPWTASLVKAQDATMVILR
jgi:hypothetical protein